MRAVDDPDMDSAEPAEPAVAVRTGSSRAVLLLAALLVAVLEQAGRPLPALWPQRHPDNAWMVGLQLLRDDHLTFGADQVFTYGPWGFLTAPTGIDLSDLWLAGAFRAGAVALLFLGVHGCLRGRSWSLTIAAVVTLLIGNCSQAGWILALALAAVALSHLSARRPPAPWLLVATAALAALGVQVKFSDGVLAVAVVGLLSLSTRSPRTWLVSAAAFVASSGLLWMAAGQSLRDLPGWLSMAVDIVDGYSEAMAFVSSSWIVWVLMVGAVVATVAVLAARGLPPVARLAALGVLLFATKSALTRPDGPHILPGYTAVLLVLVVALGASLPRVVRVLVIPVSVVTALLMMVNLSLIPTRDLSIEAWPLDALPDEHARRLDEVRAEVVDQLAMGPEVVGALRGHPVSIDPWEISAAWAHDLDWDPLPVFQSYAAYTPRLDEANADALLEDPEHRVLREQASYGEANPLWDTPAYTLALVCNFDEVVASGDWTVLARTPDRCGAERVTSTRRVRAGEEVEVPAAAGTLVVVRFTPDPRSVVDRLIAVTGVQRHLLHATLDDRTYRVPEALAGGPLVVGAPAGEPVLGDDVATGTVSFDRDGELAIVEIPLAGREAG
ncbi:hypothetical protein [Nocardioides currus]|uniref:Glycosyltransferase RgtA/B/C/D-like domain-containing protein n=1 Tax=Nocardioides currus TaxID=2133958 RepID=A0A2R7YW94_9ACTN|nr:hypothetical protein [Nocardioides currus]PUA80584.1 hypothetical protein C7S10_12540 [Nocardioides currus]